MEMVLSSGFSETTQEEMREIKGGYIISGISSIVYFVDLYNYYTETEYVTSYNDTVMAAGRPDLVKQNPTIPEYDPLYVFTR